MCIFICENKLYFAIICYFYSVLHKKYPKKEFIRLKQVDSNVLTRSKKHSQKLNRSPGLRFYLFLLRIIFHKKGKT